MMRAVLAAALLAGLARAAHNPNPSPGCSAEYDEPTGQLVQRKIFVNDTNANAIQRRYTQFVPEGIDPTAPPPLMFWFHGQYGHGKSDAEASTYVDYPMVQLYPQGLGPQDGGGCGTGWNTGPSGHDSSTCKKEAFGSTCCYDSCMGLGVCSGGGANAACGWATCYDDVDFVKALLDHAGKRLCFDMDAVFVTGASNGGMMTHYLYQALPDTFRAVLPVYGSPLVGYNQVVQANQDTSILQLHDRSDTIIPVAGGDGDGWYYEPAADVLGSWAALHGCAADASPVTTPYDGGSVELSCTEWLGCTDGKRVMLCMYDGQHGSWPSQGEALSYWFFNSTL